MGKYFTFENYKKFYNYIIFSILALLFYYLCFGINYNAGFQTLRLFPFESQGEYAKHSLIRQIFCYFGTSIISILFYLKGVKRESFHIEDYRKIANDEKTYKSIVYRYAKEQNISYSFFIFIIFIWVFLEQANDIFKSIFLHFDFWMIELLIITFLNAKMFKMNIYKHQLFAIYLNLFPILFKIGTIYLTFKGTTDSDKSIYLDHYGNLKILYVIYWPLIFPGFFIYLILIGFLRSYVYIQLKRFMDLKFMSPSILLFIYGIIGTIFYSGICVFTTFIKCDSSEKTNIFDYICTFKDNNNNKFFENYSFYFAISKDIIFEILTNILATISYFLYIFFMILSINYLTPVHIMFIVPMLFFIRKIIALIFNCIMYKIKGGVFVKDYDARIFMSKYLLDFLGDFFSIIGFLIYLEILKLSFCGLDYNLRHNIIKRGKNDSIGLIQTDLNLSSSSEQIDEEEEEKEKVNNFN